MSQKAPQPQPDDDTRSSFTSFQNADVEESASPGMLSMILKKVKFTGNPFASQFTPSITSANADLDPSSVFAHEPPTEITSTATERETDKPKATITRNAPLAVSVNKNATESDASAGQGASPQSS